MSKIVTKEEAARYLSDVPMENSFWVNNGPILKNLDELAEFLPKANDETYSHHANQGKNDFSKWISDIIGDKKLANELLSSKSKESAAKKLKARLAMLRKKAN